MSSKTIDAEVVHDTSYNTTTKRTLASTTDDQNDEPQKRQKVNESSSLTPLTSPDPKLSDRHQVMVSTRYTTTENFTKSEPIPSEHNTSSAAPKQSKRARTLQWLKKQEPRTGLRSELKTRFPYEVWENIVGHCEPIFLHNTARRISPFIRQISMDHGEASDKIWRQSRFRTYGPCHPDLHLK